jgi:hypothetical protein
MIARSDRIAVLTALDTFGPIATSGMMGCQSAYCSYSKECESSLTLRRTLRIVQTTAFPLPSPNGSIGMLRWYGLMTDSNVQNV